MVRHGEQAPPRPTAARAGGARALDGVGVVATSAHEEGAKGMRFYADRYHGIGKHYGLEWMHTCRLRVLYLRWGRWEGRIVLRGGRLPY